MGKCDLSGQSRRVKPEQQTAHNCHNRASQNMRIELHVDFLSLLPASRSRAASNVPACRNCNRRKLRTHLIVWDFLPPQSRFLLLPNTCQELPQLLSFLKKPFVNTSFITASQLLKYRSF